VAHNQQTNLLKLNLDDKALFLTNPYHNTHLSTPISATNNLSSFTQDTALNYFESEVIRNDNLEALVWIYDDKLGNNTTFNFFNYNNYTNQFPATLDNQPYKNFNKTIKSTPTTLQSSLDYTKVM
jgi:hypothetical protein